MNHLTIDECDKVSESEPVLELTLPTVSEEDDIELFKAIQEGRNLKPFATKFANFAANHLISRIPKPNKAQYNRYAIMCIQEYVSLADTSPSAKSTHVIYFSFRLFRLRF